MKKLFFICLIITMNLSLFALDIINFAPFSGNVKSYTQTDFSITSKFGDLFRTPTIKIIHNFDEEGLESEVIEMSPKDVVQNRTISKYDMNNNLIEQDCYDANDILLWKTVITYKNNHKVDSSEYGKNGSLRGKVIYTYDGDFLTEETGYDEDGSLVWKTVYKYADGKLKVMSQYSYDGSLDEECTYEYLDDGRMNFVKKYDTFTQTTYQQIFRYAANGSLSEITTYDNNKQISNRMMLKYDNSGNLAKFSSYAISEKFGTTVNELVRMSEYVYSDTITPIKPAKSVSNSSTPIPMDDNAK